MAISKQPVELRTNTVGIVVSMVDNQFGIIQFPNGTGTEKALFSAKSLYKDGWLYKDDPMKLPREYLRLSLSHVLPHIGR